MRPIPKYPNFPSKAISHIWRVRQKYTQTERYLLATTVEEMDNTDSLYFVPHYRPEQVLWCFTDGAMYLDGYGEVIYYNGKGNKEFVHKFMFEK